MKTLKQLLEKKTDKAEPTAPIEPDSVTSYVPKSKDEKRFMDKHVVQKTDDVNGNGDDVFRGSNIKAYDRSSTRHGYNTKQDQQVYETKQLKSLTQILGEKTLTSAEMKKREEVAKAMERENPGMDKSKKMAIATATAKRVAEEAEQVDEAVRHDQYVTYHAGVKDMLKKIGMHVDAHKEAAMAPTDYNKEKGANMHTGHVYTMKTMHRTLQDIHDQLQGEVEYAQPPKPIRLKEENELFSMFSDDVKEQLEAVFEAVDDECKQIIIEMVEAEEYDELANVVSEVING